MSKVGDNLFEEFEHLFRGLPLFRTLDIKKLIEQGKLQNQQKEQNQETFEVTKGNVKTQLYVRFNELGYPISIMHESNYIPSDTEVKLNKLKLDLDIAVSREDYKLAHLIQGEIKEMETNQ